MSEALAQLWSTHRYNLWAKNRLDTRKNTSQTLSLVEDTNNLGYLNWKAALPNQIHMKARLTRGLSKPHNQKLNLTFHLGDP